MWAMIVKEFRQVRRDRRTLAMMIVLPVLLLIVLGYAASFDVKSIPVAVAGPQAAAAESFLRAPFDVTTTQPGEGLAWAQGQLRDGKADMAVVTGGARPVILIDGTQIFAAQAARAGLARLGGVQIRPVVRILYNPDLKTSYIMIPGLCGVVLVFVGTIITSLGVVRERQSGTMEQLAVMPLKPRDVFLGKIVPYFLVATSSVSQNSGQAIQLAMMIMVPQILLSGLVFPLSSVPIGVRWIAYLLPLTYFIEIARGVMLRAEPIAGLWQSFVYLAVLGSVVVTAATLRFRRYLAPAHRAHRARGEAVAAQGAGA